MVTDKNITFKEVNQIIDYIRAHLEYIITDHDYMARIFTVQKPSGHYDIIKYRVYWKGNDYYYEIY